MRPSFLPFDFLTEFMKQLYVVIVNLNISKIHLCSIFDFKTKLQFKKYFSECVKFTKNISKKGLFFIIKMKLKNGMT